MRWASTWDRGVEKFYLCKPITCEASTDMPSSRVQGAISQPVGQVVTSGSGTVGHDAVITVEYAAPHLGCRISDGGGRIIVRDSRTDVRPDICFLMRREWRNICISSWHVIGSGFPNDLYEPGFCLVRCRINYWEGFAVIGGTSETWLVGLLSRDPRS